MKALALPAKTGYVEQVYAAVLDAICAGTLPAGESLTQDGIAERLHVSRQPVGQALALLKAQGFVRDRGRRGLAVAPLDPGLVRAIYQLRAALDRLAAELAARRADSAAIARGEEIVRAGERALATRSVRRLIALDRDFHRYVYDLSGNALIADAMNHYWDHLRRVMGSVIRIAGYRGQIWAEHRTLLEAIAAGAARRAGELAARHAESASESLQASLAAAPGRPAKA